MASSDLCTLCESAMHARERRNVSHNASLALLRGRVVDIYGRDVEVFIHRRCHRKLAATAKRKEDRIKCRERTQRVATSASRTSVRAGTPRSCATKPRPHATSKARKHACATKPRPHATSKACKHACIYTCLTSCATLPEAS